jgi:hypothetical protein
MKTNKVYLKEIYIMKTMKLVPTNIDKIMLKRYGRSDNLGLLNEFADSNLVCAEVINYPHKSANCCATSLQASIRRYKMSRISCTTVNGRVILVKWDMIDHVEK